jgi:hypothetical protein
MRRVQVFSDDGAGWFGEYLFVMAVNGKRRICQIAIYVDQCTAQGNEC